MKIAVKEGEKGFKNNHGGPFGAVIIRKGKIIAKAHNEVLKNNDPTCHAEIQAIRNASKKLKSFNLSDCELYCICEPCPMCLSAIHWARIKKLYFGCTRKDAAKIGFDDKLIYDIIKGKAKSKTKKEKINRQECLKIFKEFESKKDKELY